MKILIIADLPRPDRSSAGFRFYNIIKLMAETCKINFCALDYYDRDLSEDAKTEDYRRKTEDIGVSISKASIAQSLLSEKYDAIFFEYYFTAEHYLDMARKLQPSARFFIDTVDVHYRRLFSKANLTQKEGDYTDAMLMKSRELAIYKKADVLIAVTEDDKKALQKENQDFCIEVIPNIHTIAEDKAVLRRKGADLIFIGTFHHEPNVDAMLYFVNDIWTIVKRAIPQARLKIVGTSPTTEIQALASDSIEVTGYVENTLPYLQASSISIAPLRFGAGMKGKIGEAMAAGLPVVTTTTGAEGMGLTHGIDVLIADTPDDFAACISSLIRNDSLYADIVSKGLQFMRDNYSDEAVRVRVKEVFSNVNKYPSVYTHQLFDSIERLRYSINLFLQRNVLWRLKGAGR
ncbi:MAG: glycosyltransferase [Nitrospirae bacterium]|nr:glycosyltransferase [Nitrospirota bacterium]